MIPLPWQWDRDGIEIMIPIPYQWVRDENGIMISLPSRSRDLIFDSVDLKFAHSVRTGRSRNPHARDGKCSSTRADVGSWNRVGGGIMIPTPWQWERDHDPDPAISSLILSLSRSPWLTAVRSRERWAAMNFLPAAFKARCTVAPHTRARCEP